jgi:hypothetical protein
MDRREVLRQKLRQKIKDKRTQSQLPSLKETNKAKKEYKREVQELDADPRITPDMVSLYREALMAFPDNNLSNPKQILDDPSKHKKEYGNYVLAIMKKAKEKSWGVNAIRSLLVNSYTKYMTHMLGLDEVPAFLRA